VSISVQKGEVVALIGANGAGKSTLLKLVIGMSKTRSGSVSFDGVSITGHRSYSIIRRGIGYVPEGRRLFGAMSVEENLRIGAPRKCADLLDRMKYVKSLFPILEERRYQHASTLSGGEQQMVAIGRALMGKPKLLLLDELSFGLSPKMFTRVLRAIQEANRNGVSILLAEQNSEKALEVSNRAYVMENGRLVGEGKSESLKHDAKVRQAYLGLVE
jgi:branched-chain amino acid transport system ATP-binding protein